MSRPQGVQAPSRPALRRTVSLVAPHTRGHRRLAAGGLLALFLEVAFRIAEPWPVKYVLDAVVPAAVGQPVPSDVTTVVLLAGGAVLLLAAGRAGAAYLSTLAFAYVGARTTESLRAAVHDRLLHAAPAFHAGSRTGDLVTRVIGDVGRVQEAVITAGLPLVGSLLTFAAMAVVMVVLDPLLALAVCTVFPVLLLAGRHSGSRITKASRRQRAREGDLAADAAEAFATISFLQAYDLQQERARRFEASNDGSLREGMQARRLAAGLERRVDVLVGFATAVVLVVGATRVTAGALTIGELVVFLTYLKTAFKPVRDLAKHTGRIARAAASGERVADALDEAQPLPEPVAARVIRRLAGRIELESVTAGYDPDRPVLRGADLLIRPGERVALVGPSGSGKSTTLQLLLRLLDPAGGRLLLDGHDAADLSRASVRAQVAVVLQESVLLTASIRDNVRLGRPDADDAAVADAVRRAGALDVVAGLPDGYDTVVSERGASLSGGQRQRIAIARAILRDPAVLLLDEPTTGLDDASAATVLDGLERLAAGRTTVLVTHDERLLSFCHRVIHLRDGRFEEAAQSAGGILPPVPTTARLARRAARGGPR